MSSQIIGINKYPTASPNNNTIEAVTAPNFALLQSEGIISGLQVQAEGSPSNQIKIKVGNLAINCAGSMQIYKSKVDFDLTIPDLGNSFWYLVVMKVDFTNLTADIIAIEGTTNTDPNLVEGGSPEVYYLPIARIANTAATTIDSSQIVQDNNTQTNNSTPETLGRVALGRFDISSGWEPSNDVWIYLSSTTFKIKGDQTNKYFKGDKLRWKQGAGFKYDFITIAPTYDGTNTTITISGNIGFTVANSTITDNYFSKDWNPSGFPIVAGIRDLSSLISLNTNIGTSATQLGTYTIVYPGTYRITTSIGITNQSVDAEDRDCNVLIKKNGAELRENHTYLKNVINGVAEFTGTTVVEPLVVLVAGDVITVEAVASQTGIFKTINFAQAQSWMLEKIDYLMSI